MAIISDNIIKWLNYRIEQEEYSSRLYKSMAVWLEFNGYSGAAKLWNAYAEDEKIHAGWAYQYLLDLNIKPIVPALPAPENSFRDLPQIIAMSLKHELAITHQCENLARTSQEEGDYTTLGLAQQYLKEQVEELGKTQYWVDRLNIFGTDKIALRLLDQEMGEK